jgi:hypothetical protein
MLNFRDLMAAIRTQPGYTLMRGLARFETVRAAVAGSRGIAQRRNLERLLRSCESQMQTSPFATVSRADLVEQLRKEGVAPGLTLPQSVVDEIVDFASRTECFADRKPEFGFRLRDRAAAEAHLKKTILVAQYFNTEAGCAAVRRLAEDPALRWIAGSYLRSVPTFVGANLWWTFPVVPLERDRDLHAHLFHRDVDDFRFFKFFFYLTPVEKGDGAHVCVASSHENPPVSKLGDRWNLRRYSDIEIARTYPPANILEICGPAGTGFAENTLCIHKGLTPTDRPRLLLQLQYSLFDYGVMHDRRETSSLRMIATDAGSREPGEMAAHT